jgi:hypothetical protein
MTSVRLLCLEIRATQKDCVLFVTQYSSVTQNSFLLVPYWKANHLLGTNARSTESTQKSAHLHRSAQRLRAI